MKMIQSLIVAGTILSSTSAFAQSANSDEIRSTVAEMLKDAEARTSLLSAGDSGHDGRFFLASDGFRLNIGGDLRVRYGASFNRDSSADDFESGFSLPLARLRFDGTVANNWDFAVTGAFANDSDGPTSNDSFALEDAWIGTSLFETGKVRFGQFRLPFMAEVRADERSDLASARSVMSDVFGQGRSQGIEASFGLGESLRFTAAFSDGFSTANSDFDDSVEADYALTGRLDWSVLGVAGASNSLNLGGAFHFQDGGDSDRFYSYTADVSYNADRFSLLAAGVGRNFDNDSDYNDWGALAQFAFRVTDTFEPFARYDVVFADEDRALANDTYNFVTGGFNYYFADRAVKFTADAVWALDSTEGLNALGDFSNTSLLGSLDENEVAIRAQFQLLF